ncbi:MAG: hypothetical protein V4574_20295 [Pseudomonadota bacterium]
MTETEDHVPSRECFRDRVGPEGFAFPACKICNNGAGQLEQVVALYLLLANHDDANVSPDQLRRLILGVGNNNRDLLPSIEVNARAARRHFRNKGMQLAPGAVFGEMPIATLPSGHREAFELFGRRLTCAIYYKEVGRPLPLDHYLVAAWLPWSEAMSGNIIETAVGLFPTLTITNRRNTDIGDQFSYRWGFHPDGSIFGFVAQFSKSYYFICAAAAPNLHNANNEGIPGWKLHANDVVL